MATKPAGPGKRKLRSVPQELREREAHDRTLIRTSMRKWEDMDETARLLGRGLGRKDLIDRVAREVGKSLRIVHAALKPKR